MPRGPACTITGTDNKDFLVGTSGDDVICGLGSSGRRAMMSCSVGAVTTTSMEGSMLTPATRVRGTA
jgi:hypothetical protein